MGELPLGAKIGWVVLLLVLFFLGVASALWAERIQEALALHVKRRKTRFPIRWLFPEALIAWHKSKQAVLSTRVSGVILVVVVIFVAYLILFKTSGVPQPFRSSH
jgi:hypothetical protein